jgi:hypothetical protein
MSRFTNRAMSAEVSPELLTASMEAIGELPADQRGSFEGRAFRLFRLLEERNEAQEAALTAFAIQLRLEALARLHDDRGLRAWTLPGDAEGADYIHADVVAAAAVEPLLEIDDHTVGFDPDSFRARVLADSAARGHA